MSSKNNSSEQCILPSDLSLEQMKSLPFVPGSLTSFDERAMLPPTARPQWKYLETNPEDFINRFTAELGLLGVNVAVCFINNDRYEDKEKDLKTPITVYLFSTAKHFQNLKKHLENKRLSHQVMEGNKGFKLPYLGSIEKQIDVLGMESLMNYIFVKNSISKESYITWLSVPKSYLDNLEAQLAEKKSAAEKLISKATRKESKTDSDSSEGDDSESSPSEKENFNYVIYDDDETESEDNNLKGSTVVSTADSNANQQSSRKKQIKKVKKKIDKTAQKNPAAKLESSLFLSLGLFNFFCSLVLLTFLVSTVSSFASILTEAAGIAMLVSLLFAYLVLRPSFKQSGNRIWSLAAYTAYFGVTGFQIYYLSQNPNSLNYLLPTAIALVCLVTAAVFGFLRIDRLAIRKPDSDSAPTEAAKASKSPIENPSPATTSSKEESQSPFQARKFPAPARPQAKKQEKKRIEMKRSASKPQQDNAEPISSAAQGPAHPPTSEEQKQVIRNRLARADQSTVSSEANGTGLKLPNEDSTEPKDTDALSAKEIRAKLASGIEQVRAVTQAQGESEEAESSEDTRP